MSSTKVITVANHKGGVGKTSIVVNLAAEFGRLGLKTIVVDLDPQGNVSTHISKLPVSNLQYSIADLLATGKQELLVDIIQDDTNMPNVSLIPATTALLAIADGEKLKSFHDNPYLVLNRILSLLDGIYDVILIDTRPNLDILMINALACSTHYIVPLLSGSPYSIDGVSNLLPFIDNVKRINPGLEMLGFLLNGHNDRLKADRLTKDIILRTYGETLPVMPIYIPHSTAVGYAAMQGKAVCQTEPESVIAQKYEQTAYWIAKKIGLKK